MAAKKPSDEKLLQVEAEAAMREVLFAVDSVELSKVLPSTSRKVYMNLRTKEQKTFCVELSVAGFKVSSFSPTTLGVP